MLPSSLHPLILTAVALISGADALGINCRGSAKCSGLFGPPNVARDLTNIISKIDDNRWYYGGEQIACVGNQVGNGGGYCAFLQNISGAHGRNIKAIAHFIPGHGCTMCGSVPVYYPNDNNVDNGQLTYNFVSTPCAVSGVHLC